MAELKIVKIPDIGGASSVDVIEILVKIGDVIGIDTPLITLESDKASMEIPSPIAGVVELINVKLGDKVSEGDPVLSLVQIEAKEEKSTIEPVVVEDKAPVIEQSPLVSAPNNEVSEPISSISGDAGIAAGPAVRRLARELGVSLIDVSGSGRKARITKEDVTQYVKNRLSSGDTKGFSYAPTADIDFSKFGAIQIKPLSKIKRLTGSNVHRSWITIPHVTQFDEADITDLEAFRKDETPNAHQQGFKLTMLAFICKVVAHALRVFPEFNASLDSTGQNLILKEYFNIGIAVETPNGLVVPVVRDVGQLSVADIAKEMARLSLKAREKGLMPNDMNGGSFTISSLGGIGGTSFTPIVNAPEVAILGVSRSSIKPIYINGEFKPRLMLPLSLSYDHRVIDGAEAARFARYLCEVLSDIRRILL